MHDVTAGPRLVASLVFLVSMGTQARQGHAAPCPEAGASLEIVLAVPGGTASSTVALVGILRTGSCDDDDARLASTYAHSLTCSPDQPDACRLVIDGLRPGTWTHRIVVTDGEAAGQLQGRVQLLLDRSAGQHRLDWTLFRSVHTVSNIADVFDCTGCLRAAITSAEMGAKPALVQFAPDVRGSIRLLAALPPLAAGQVTIDGYDGGGIPLSRTIDAQGLDAAALRIVGGANHVLGLRVVNVGGDSDAIVVEGPTAIDNVLDEMQVVGRATSVCAGGNGCVLDGICLEPTRQVPQGFCGNDGVAVRDRAGVGGANRIRRSLMTAALDKGVKVSEGGVAVVEDSAVIANGDGGMQATLSGHLIARRNVVSTNRGTTSANGLAANGPAGGSPVAAVLETHANLCTHNALRGISVRSFSVAALRDDFVCGNAVGLALLDAAGLSAVAAAEGLAIVRNGSSGVVVADGARVSFGDASDPGANAIAFNGLLTSRTTPVNFRNQTSFSISAVGNFWERCGDRMPCNSAAVQALDIFTASLQAPVRIVPARPTRQLGAPQITAVEPPFAAAGDTVRIFGSGFDAIAGTAAACNELADINTCHPLRGNCVLIDRVPAEVIAVTPTMLVVRAPFTCVEPVTIATRTRWSHGFGRAQFCVVPSDA